MPKDRTYSKAVRYKRIFNRCLNPNCEGLSPLEAHHIIPITHGGEDSYCNFITLCRKCHKSLRVHGFEAEIQIVLFKYKLNAEYQLFSATSCAIGEKKFSSMLGKEIKARYSL